MSLNSTITDHSSKKVWNLNFFLLWQGQLISGVGDFFYQIALGFWVLAVTGSTALMASIMAASFIPQIIFSPIAGVIIDRVNRKHLIIILDTIRGIAVLFVAIAAFTGILQIWMVFITGVILGICLSFFNPAVRSVIPDLVHRSNLIKANAAFTMIYATSKIIGDSVGGFLFLKLGVGLVFLVNGLSYLFSAVTELFIQVPENPGGSSGHSFLSEMKAGIMFTWHSRGLRHLFLTSLASNYAIIIGYTLILPLFQSNKHLGPGLYGIVTASAAVGALFCLILSFQLQITPKHRFTIMCIFGALFSLSRMLFPFFLQMHVMLPLMFISGFSLSIPIILFDASIPLNVPAHMRGKIFSLMATVTTGVWPLGMITGGILAEFISIPLLIALSSAVVLFSYVMLFFSQSAKQVVNRDSSEPVT